MLPDAPKPNRRDRTLRGTLLVCLGAILVTLALLHVWPTNRMLEPAPNDPASRVAFTCQECGRQFSLTGRQIDEALRSVSLRSPREGGDVGFPCPHCGKHASVRTVAKPD